MKDHLTLGSLFDGIGGWQLAAIHNGVEPIWSSEIEAFPCAVTKKHFPNTIQLGDITKLNGAEIPPVDIICAGSPCQDLSVAGKQEGLKGARSGLFMDAVRVIRQMRSATNGQFPRWFVWENVCGAFSSNSGADFRAVLEEIGQTSIPMPEGGKWANAGLAELPECEIAWRILDAQHHVPQRRKRIFLVADFGAERRCAGEILLVEPRLCGDSQESRGPREGLAAGVESGSCGASVVRMRAGCAGGGKGALVSRERSLTLAANTNDQVLFTSDKARSITHAQGTERTAVAVYDMTHADEVMRPVEGGKCQTLNARMGTGGNQVPVVSYCVCNGQLAKARLSDKVGTLNCMHDQQAVMIEKSVRRLTPTECERLQGLPDGYTLIDDKTCSNSARYRALGNGMAQPCADYVLRRIKEVSEA